MTIIRVKYYKKVTKVYNDKIQGDDSYLFLITELRKKDFIDTEIEIIKTLEKNNNFIRYLISYNSEGLKITGMMNVPHGNGPFPSVILNHGYYKPKKFFIGAGFKKAADIFARNGYIAVGSDFRNHGNSDKGKNFFQHIGFLYDVLYLVEAVKKLPYIDRERIGMWGFSGGGWLTLKAIVIERSIKVAALFGSMSADDIDNYKALYKWHTDVIKEVNRIIGTPPENPEAYANMSPMNFLKDMPNYIIIHRGGKDKIIPVEWSERLRNGLVRESKVLEFYSYPEQGHVLQGKAWNISMDRTIKFFNRYL